MDNIVPASMLSQGQAPRILKRVSDEHEVIIMKNNQPIAVIISPEQYKGYCALAEECHSLLDASVLSLDACSRIQDLLKKIKLFAED